MSSGVLILAIGFFFLLVNIYWNNKLFEKKNQLDERERNLNEQIKEIMGDEE